MYILTGSDVNLKRMKLENLLRFNKILHYKNFHFINVLLPKLGHLFLFFVSNSLHESHFFTLYMYIYMLHLIVSWNFNQNGSTRIILKFREPRNSFFYVAKIAQFCVSLNLTLYIVEYII